MFGAWRFTQLGRSLNAGCIVKKNFPIPFCIFGNEILLLKWSFKETVFRGILLRLTAQHNQADISGIITALILVGNCALRVWQNEAQH